MKQHESADNSQGQLFIVPTPIGNLADITQRALEVLQAVDLIAAEDTRHTGLLLQHFAINARLFALHDHNEQQKAETLAHYSVRTAKYINGQRKNAPYQKAARLQHKAEKAEIKAIHEKTLAENPQLKKSAIKKFQQKQWIKKQYQKAKQAEQTAKAAKKR